MRFFFRALPLLVLAIILGSPPASATKLTLSDRCGPPVERYCGGEFKEVLIPGDTELGKCTSQQMPGTPCDQELGAPVCVAREGFKCVSDSGLVQFTAHEILRECATPGRRNCPISTRKAKEEIRYLSDTDRKKAASEILSLKLAQYRYKPEYSEDRGPQLGFIIEDVAQPSPLVMEGIERVNLYGYISAVVATLQVQSKQIQALKDEITRLREAQLDPMVRAK